MKYKWRKLGLIFSPNGETQSLKTHAAVPIAEHLSGDIFKIYFTSRDILNRSYTNFIILDIKKYSKIIDLSLDPVLKPGKLGEFDDSGAMATSLVCFNEKKYLYYIGWNLGKNVPFRNSIGLAVSEGGQPFQKISNGPILDRGIHDPMFVTSCFVLPEMDKWRIWYTSCTDWVEKSNNSLQHKYHIKYAESSDGIIWNRQGIVAIDYANNNEYAICRPSIIKDNNLYMMWFSCRGKFYKLGYAESSDGVTWKRNDKNVGIDLSASGWDSEMIEYPHVFKHNNNLYMLYNGNGYGKTGFGLAVLEC